MSRVVLRCALGAVLGAIAWLVLSRLLPHVPLPLRFAIASLAFTWGPGAVVGARLTRDLPAIDRAIVMLGLGSAVAPVIVDLLGRMHWLAAFPFVATAMTGAGIALWPSRSRKAAEPISWADVACCAILVALACGLGAIVFWHRLMPDDGGLLLYGNYDSFDLSFYAVWAAEATHTVPPTASYYAGHALNAAYYPQFVPAMVHEFADVPLLSVYFRYAWPAALSLGALAAFALTRTLAPRGAALLAAILMLSAGDFSYLAAWWLPHEGGQWDFLLWPTNFLSPTMEVLYFNTWAQSLPVFFTTLYAIVQALRMRSRGWTLAGACLLAALFQFKVFAFAVLVAGLSGAAVFSWRDRDALRRLAAIVVGGILLALPFLYSVAALQRGPPHAAADRLVPASPADAAQARSHGRLLGHGGHPVAGGMAAAADLPAARDDPLFRGRPGDQMAGVSGRLACGPRRRGAGRGRMESPGLDRGSRGGRAVRAGHRSVRRHPAVLPDRAVRLVDFHGDRAREVRARARGDWCGGDRGRDRRLAALLDPFSGDEVDRRAA